MKTRVLAGAAVALALVALLAASVTMVHVGPGGSSNHRSFAVAGPDPYMPPADALPVNPAVASIAEGKVAVLVGSNRPYGYRIGDRIPIRILIVTDPTVEVKFDALVGNILKRDGSDFELVEPAAITSSTENGKRVWQVDVLVRSWVMRPALTFDLEFLYSTKTLADGKTRDWKVGTTPAFTISTSQTASPASKYLDQGDLNAISLGSGASPLGLWLMSLGALLAFLPFALLAIKFASHKRPKRTRSIALTDAERAWQVFDREFASGRATGFTQSNYRQIAAALRNYLKVDALTMEEVVSVLSEHTQLATISGALTKCQRVLYAGETLTDGENDELYRELEEIVPRKPATSDGVAAAGGSNSSTNTPSNGSTSGASTVEPSSGTVALTGAASQPDTTADGVRSSLKLTGSVRNVPERGNKVFGRFLGNRLARSVSYLVLSLVFVGILAFYAISNGGITNPFSSKPEVTWLHMDNVQSELSLTMDPATGNIKAAPGQNVLIVFCTSDSCNSELLALPEVVEKYKGKVKVLALNPYKEFQLTQLLTQQFVGPAVQQEVVFTMAVQYASAQQKDGTQLTQAAIEKVMADPQFQQLAQQQLASLPLLAPVYPKYFLFQAKSFQLVAADQGLETKEQLISFIDSGLQALSQAAGGNANSTAGGSTATSTPATTPSGTGTPAGSTTPTNQTGTVTTATPGASSKSSASGADASNVAP